MIEQLGPYRIERVLGRGGMGTVYAGIHQETGERAAVKVLSQALADDGNFADRFLAEIETLKQLKHPNIVELYGDGEQDGLLFYAMEYVDGQSLQQELQSGHLFDWTEVTKIAIHICNALKHGHDHGVIHRDLKPANLLRGSDGWLKLSDFGIAKSFRFTNLTADGSVVGTADYMAPEQAEGRPVNNRTDLYSLGTVMFTLLARRPPFAGGSIPQVLHKLRYEDAPSVRKFAPTVPLELEQIISQLLSKEGDERIPTALVLANRLKAMEHGLASGTVVDSIEAFEDPEPSQNDTPTRVSKVGNGPVTEISPTAVDPGEGAARNGPYSWNDATVVTSESDPGSDQQRQVSRADTVVDEKPANKTRFTTIEEDRRQRELERAGKWTQHLPTIALVIALIGLAAAVYIGMQPPSEEELFARISAAAAAGKIKDVKADVDRYIELFGDQDHERVDTVRKWELDISCEFLFTRLRQGFRRGELTEVQTLCHDAMKAAAKKPQTARRLFTELLANHRADPDEPNPITCVQAAEHHLKRLAELPADSQASDGAVE